MNRCTGKGCHAAFEGQEPPPGWLLGPPACPDCARPWKKLGWEILLYGKKT
jgi:hypothetical protein